MVSSIGSSINSAAMMSSSSMSRPPEGKNAFTVSDSNGDGVVSGDELTALAEGLSEVTGTTVTTDDVSNFDSNSDGLSGEEMFEMLSSMGFSPGGAEAVHKVALPHHPLPPKSYQHIHKTVVKVTIRSHN